MKLAREFSWSLSRLRLFHECRRAYYFHYYASWGGWERGADERTKELYLLKKLQGRYAWVGGLIHAAIRDVLNAIRSGIAPSSAAAVTQAAIEVMRSQFASSRVGEYRYRKAPGLLEHEYGLEVPDEQWQRLAGLVRDALAEFCELAPWNLAPKDKWGPVDQVSTVSIGGVKVYAAPDFSVTESERGLLIIDWKTGRPRDDHPGQLGLYSLFERMRGYRDQWIWGELRYLGRGRVEARRCGEEDALEWAARIHQSTRQMAEMLIGGDLEANEPLPEKEFNQTDDRETCRRCRFQRICWPEG